MLALLQIPPNPDSEPPIRPGEYVPPGLEYPHGPLDGLISIGSSLVGILMTALWVWMVVECLRRDAGGYWLWIILFFPPVGPLAYFFVRWLPDRQVRLPSGLRKWARRGEIVRLETAARQIGNAHQFVQLGDGLRETGNTERAATAYASALEKEPDNPQALWGAALVELELKNFEAALEHLDTLMKIDPQYKFGDVSLAYGRTLANVDRDADAATHLQHHIKRWRHPEAFYLLACLAAEQGLVDEARSHLDTLLLDLDGTPKAIARRHSHWKGRAKRLLRKLTTA